jgi:hypothetical protein
MKETITCQDSFMNAPNYKIIHHCTECKHYEKVHPKDSKGTQWTCNWYPFCNKYQIKVDVFGTCDSWEPTVIMKRL